MIFAIKKTTLWYLIDKLVKAQYNIIKKTKKVALMNINTTIREIAEQIEAKDLTEVLVDLISKIIEIFIENELTEFLQYEKHSVEGNNSGKSRN